MEDSFEVLASDVPSSNESFVEIITNEEDLFSSSMSNDIRKSPLL